MFFPKIKLSKTNWQLWACLITVVLVAIGSIQTCRATRWERAHLRLEGKLAEQQKDQDLLYGEAEKERAERNIEEAKEKKKRKELEARIKQVIREGEKAKRALVIEWRKTTTLPPDELCEQINERIGEESRPTAAGFFLFTRTGTERTLNRFKEGEFHLSEYNKFQQVLADHETEVESFNVSIAECEATVTTNLTGWDDCRETLATAQKDIVTLEKMGKASVWRGRKQGAIAILIIAGGLKLAGVW